MRSRSKHDSQMSRRRALRLGRHFFPSGVAVSFDEQSGFGAAQPVRRSLDGHVGTCGSVHGRRTSDVGLPFVFHSLPRAVRGRRGPGRARCVQRARAPINPPAVGSGRRRRRAPRRVQLPTHDGLGAARRGTHRCRPPQQLRVRQHDDGSPRRRRHGAGDVRAGRGRRVRQRRRRVHDERRALRAVLQQRRHDR